MKLDLLNLQFQSFVEMNVCESHITLTDYSLQ